MSEEGPRVDQPKETDVLCGRGGVFVKDGYFAQRSPPPSLLLLLTHDLFLLSRFSRIVQSVSLLP